MIALSRRGGLGRVRVRALAGLRDDHVDDAQRQLVGGGHAHRQRRGWRLVRRSATGSTAQPSGEMTE